MIGTVDHTVPPLDMDLMDLRADIVLVRLWKSICTLQPQASTSFPLELHFLFVFD